MMRVLFVLTIVLFALLGCKKAEDRACFKKNGEMTSREISLPDFKRLRVGARIEVELVPSTENKLVIHGGENLVNFIHADLQSDGMLYLTNENGCHSFRNLKKGKIKVEVHFIELNELYFEGTEDLVCRSILTGNNFKLSIQDAGSTVYLDLDYQRVTVIQGHGYGDFVLNGHCKELHLTIKSNGFGDTRGLVADDRVVVLCNSPVQSQVNLSTLLARIQIEGSGNVRYIGQPTTLEYYQTGTGNLVDGN